MNTAALLALIGDLYAQVASLQAQLDAERSSATGTGSAPEGG